MQNNRIVLDTNCLLVSISCYGEGYPVWRGFLDGRYTLCVSTDVLEEYEEIISRLASAEVARNVIDAILKRKNVLRIDPYYRWNLITTDPDDNKFVDCAIAANATYIVSDDSHFNVLRDIPFPQLMVLKLKEFLTLLNQEWK
ncbi:MAG: putative toxin-antitoxin system toxin component, PIN family [Bacteroidales bacterium]|nr:putative toxin-antitoxin system toxin component, PIN family [Bacteroidales bacterium]